MQSGIRALDAVCAFGVMHHVKRPAIVVGEMMRVARRAIFISDSNRFGQGSMPARRVKLLLWRFGLDCRGPDRRLLVPAKQTPTAR